MGRRSSPLPHNQQRMNTPSSKGSRRQGGSATSLDLGRRAATVEHLQELYAIMAGIGLAIAMSQLIRTDDAHLQPRAIPLVAAYAATLVPFYHGALRHLDESYRHEDSRLEEHRYLLLGDFIWLFTEAGTFFALASFVRRPEQFGITLSILLTLDVIWLSVWLWRSGRQTDETWWRRINVATVVLVVTLTVLATVAGLAQLPFSLVLMFLALARSGADYWLGRGFYFPLQGSAVNSRSRPQAAHTP